MKKSFVMIITAACFGLTSQVAIADVDAVKIYKSKCKMCHKFDKKKVGPAFKDMTSDAASLKDTLMNGRKMMPKFKKKLNEEQIDALVALIKSKQAAANPCANNPCSK